MESVIRHSFNRDQFSTSAAIPVERPSGATLILASDREILLPLMPSRPQQYGRSARPAMQKQQHRIS